MKKLAKSKPNSYCLFVNYMYNGLMRIAKRVGIGILLLLILTAVCQPVAAQDSTSLWFPETRHSVKGDFLKFYNSAKDPLTIFGYPITEAFLDSTNHLTQYFQRARFDLVSTERGMVVALAHLGKFLMPEIRVPYNIEQTGPTCRLFPATQKTVCYAFLQFYDANQGEIYFGDPISGLEISDGRIVQYFTNVRMEWLQNMPEGRKVVLTQLGTIAYGKFVDDDKIRNSPIPIRPADTPITKITARAFVKSILLAPGMQETIYVIVQDQNLIPVKGAQATLKAIYPDGTEFDKSQYDLTDQNGILVITLPVMAIAPKQVVNLVISVTFQTHQAKTTSWFRIWY
jgi:hypothetical protein